MEESFGAFGDHEVGAGICPSALTGNRDIVRVAAEGRDVRLHPAQGGDLVEHSEVEVFVPARSQIAEDTEAIGHGHDDDVLLGGQGVGS